MTTLRVPSYRIMASATALLAVAFAYFDSLDAPFLWDDRYLLEQNCVRSLCGISDYFKMPFWDLGALSPGVGVLYRPLTTLSLALDWHLHGQNASGFHATNILVHLVNIALVFALARRLGAEAIAAGLFALIWGLLPRLSESVAWISGRTDILYAFAALACLLVWKPDAWWRRSLAVFLGALSALAKEAGVAVLAGLIVAEYLSGSGSGFRRWRRTLAPLGALLAYLWLRHTALGGANASPTIPLTLAQRTVTIFEALGRYVWMTFDLWHPNVLIGVVGEPRWGYAALGFISTIAIAIAVYRLRPKPGPFAAAVVITGVTPIVLVVHLVAMPWVAVVGDRLLYLPWAIAACGLSVATTKLYKKSSRFRLWSVAIVGILATTLVACVRRRVRLYSDEVAFWVNAVQSSAASNWGPSQSLSGLYIRGGWPERAGLILESLRERCASPYPVRLANMRGGALSRQGRYRAALDVIQGSDEPVSPERLLFQARLKLSLNDITGAEGDSRTRDSIIPGLP